MKATEIDHHQKQVKNSDGVLSYAELLCTASTLTHLDQSLVPWFSDEIRMSNDPRVKWIDLSEAASISKQSVADHQTSHISAKDLTAEKHDPNRELNDIEAVSGHYLDHIEAVQQRDQKASPKRKRRSAKTKSKNPPKTNNPQAHVNEKANPSVEDKTKAHQAKDSSQQDSVTAKVKSNPRKKSKSRPRKAKKSST